MEDCNIIVMNLGLHYSPRGKMYGKSFQPLIGDMFAALTYLTNFTSSRDDRVAIWRSALPQHFDTSDGNYDEGELAKVKDKKCVHVKDPNSKQPYNKLYDEAFSRMCSRESRPEIDGLHLDCGSIRESCRVNVTSLDYYTVYSYWLRNNLTEDVEAFHKRHNNATMTGEIFRWNIYDLFDVPTFHSEVCKLFSTHKKFMLITDNISNVAIEHRLYAFLFCSSTV